jgi:hypothetical protein
MEELFARYDVLLHLSLHESAKIFWGEERPLDSLWPDLILGKLPERVAVTASGIPVITQTSV